MASTTKKISFVSPVYLGEKTLDILVESILTECNSINAQIEIILVEDNSPDKSWEKILMLKEKHSCIVAIKFNQNYGQQAAILAGLHETTGDYIVVLDCDMQDHPKHISQMIALIENNDVVLVKRTHKKAHFVKSILTKWFYMVFRYLTNFNHDGSIGNFGMYKKEVISQYLKLPEINKTLPVLVSWLGYKANYIYAPQEESERGQSSYNLKKLFKLALSIIIQNSNRLLYLCIWIGLSITLISVFVLIFYIYLFIAGQTQQAGFTSLILSVWFLSGLNLAFLGISGLYIAQIFNNIKNRPQYIIETKL